jgi:hypothetical protein
MRSYRLATARDSVAETRIRRGTGISRRVSRDVLRAVSAVSSRTAVSRTRRRGLAGEHDVRLGDLPTAVRDGPVSTRRSQRATAHSAG